LRRAGNRITTSKFIQKMNNEQKAQSLPSASLVQNGLLGDVDMEVLTLLCSDDDLRKWMTEPFSVGNQTCATNGWSLLVVDKRLS